MAVCLVCAIGTNVPKLPIQVYMYNLKIQHLFSNPQITHPDGQKLIFLREAKSLPTKPKEELAVPLPAWRINPQKAPIKARRTDRNVLLGWYLPCSSIRCWSTEKRRVWHISCCVVSISRLLLFFGSNHIRALRRLVLQNSRPRPYLSFSLFIHPLS